MFLACDFSGIQNYVLGVKHTGKAQAKRLRARSFLLELFEHAALVTVRNGLEVADDDVLIRGGGGFLTRIGRETDVGKIEEINAALQRRLWEETGGEVQVSLGWSETPEDARAHLEQQKRRPGFSILHRGEAWDADSLSLPPLGEPCDVCRQASSVQRVIDEDEDARHCRNCLKARRLGANLTQWEWMRPGDDDGEVQALGVSFDALPRKTDDAFRVRRWIPRTPNGQEPLTFEEIAAKARGVRRLAVMKADVDDMGVRVSEIARADATYERLKRFSRDLHTFFLDTVHEMLERSYRSIYTIYAGGDDLLLVGPWDVALDFAGTLVKEFGDGPGREWALTLSAGVALTPYRVPIRHAVERGEELLDQAKSRDGKNSCAALDAVWGWERHRSVVEDGKKLAQWVDAERDAVPRSLLHRLLTLAESDNPLRAARWAYQTERNAPRQNRDFRKWAEKVLQCLDRDEHLTLEAAASLRYALLATRARWGER